MKCQICNQEIQRENARYYIRLFDTKEHMLDFIENGKLWMNPLVYFNETESNNIIFDNSEGLICKENSGFVREIIHEPTVEEPYLEFEIENNPNPLVIDNAFIYCLYVLQKGESIGLCGNSTIINGNKITNFIGLYCEATKSRQIHLAMIYADKFDQIVDEFFRNSEYYYDNVKFVDQSLKERILAYLNKDIMGTVFVKPSPYGNVLAEKRLCIINNQKPNHLEYSLPNLSQSIKFATSMDRLEILKILDSGIEDLQEDTSNDK